MKTSTDSFRTEIYSLGCIGKGIDIWRFYAGANNFNIVENFFPSPALHLVILYVLCTLSTYCVPFTEAGAESTDNVHFYQDSIEKCWRLWRLNNISIFFHSSEGYKSHTWLGHPEAVIFPSFGIPCLLLCTVMTLLLSTHTLVALQPLVRISVTLDLRLPTMCFRLIDPDQDPISKDRHV